MRAFAKIASAILLILIVCVSCKKGTQAPKYLTENVIVVIMDGARYSETWGDPSHQYIPRLSNQMSPFGAVNTQFFNNGPTYTLAGHTSITTGFYQEIDNSGNELPKYPSIFQYYNAKYLPEKEDTWIITSKDKLEMLSNCQSIDFRDKYLPSANCGISGLGSGYRDDSVTYKVLIQTLSEYHPKLTLVNFREPDYSAHTGSWDNYLKGIRSTDEYIYRIWEYIQSDSSYNGKTTLFITNDHGRHLDGIPDGFVSHGDDCSGCRHIYFYAYGPDFKQGVILDTKRELVDITATISEILHLDMKYGTGKIMYELFK